MPVGGSRWVSRWGTAAWRSRDSPTSFNNMQRRLSRLRRTWGEMQAPPPASVVRRGFFFWNPHHRQRRDFFHGDGHLGGEQRHRQLRLGRVEHGGELDVVYYAPAPEPGSLMLAAMGGGMLFLRRRRKSV
jgi:hypothetical protein